MRHDTRQTDRRQFIAMGAGAAAAAALGWRQAAIAADVPKNPQPGAPKPEDVKLPAGGKMPMRKLGKTGVEVSLLGLGGFHIGLPKDEKTAVEIIRTAVDHGVNFMDNCWDYNDGKSQVWMGHALRDGYRKRVFPDDEDRRPHPEIRRRADRPVPARVRNRRHRPGPDPRSHPDERPDARVRS